MYGTCVTCMYWMSVERICTLRNSWYSVPMTNCPAWVKSKREWEETDTKTGTEYSELGASVGKLVQEKQAAYGDSFGKAGKVLAILYPEGIPLAKLDDALTIVRVIDKLFRIATDKDALGESPWRDICGYALLSIAREEMPNQVRSDLEGEGK